MHHIKAVAALSLVTLGFAAANACADAIPPSPDESGLVRNPPASSNAAPVAPAPAAGNTVDDFFARYDANHDGVISWNEAQADADLAHAFTRADANNDGVLTRAEFQDAAMIAYNERRSAGG